MHSCLLQLLDRRFLSPTLIGRVLTRYADFLVALKRLSFEFAGLSLNLEKAGLLLPIGAPLPCDEVRAKFPPLLDFQQEGFRVAGSPIGTDAFMFAFVNDKVQDAQSKIASIKVLGLKSPRAAHSQS